MSRELNKIFDVKSRQARRDILDKFDLSKEDKNKVLNKIDSGGGESGGSSNFDDIIYYKFKQDFYNSQEGFNKYFLFMLQHAKVLEARNGNYMDDFIIASPMYLGNSKSNGIYIFGFIFKPIISKYEELTINSVEEYYQKNNIDNFDEYLERCTAEEFYNNTWTFKFRLYIMPDAYTGDNPPLYEYSRAVKEYEIEPWMTIDDWLNSKYNIDGLRRRTDVGVGAGGEGVYIYAPYVLNGEQATYLIGHNYNPITLDLPLFNFFEPYMCEVDDGEILTHLSFDETQQPL